MTTTDRRDATDEERSRALGQWIRESRTSRPHRDARSAFLAGWDAALKPAPGTDTSGQAVQRDHGPARCVSVDDANRVLAETRGRTEDALHRVLDLADELDERYIDGDGKPITSERQAGKCAGYSLAAMKIREAVAGRPTDDPGAAR